MAMNLKAMKAMKFVKAVKKSRKAKKDAEEERVRAFWYESPDEDVDPEEQADRDRRWQLQMDAIDAAIQASINARMGPFRPRFVWPAFFFRRSGT